MKILTLLTLFFVCFSCTKNRDQITRLEDYESSLAPSRLTASNSIQEELSFWIARNHSNPHDEASLMKMAALQTELFKQTGRIEHVVLSDSLLQEVLNDYPQGNVQVFQSLSMNAIAQHQFLKAKTFAEKALAMNDKKSTSLLMLVDAALELGDYKRANEILRDFKNKKSFAYLIRKAKLFDRDGLLDSAIYCMENAYQRTKGNKAMASWTLSNLGDMYGHAGRIEESYQTYLKVLAQNPDDDYVLKGIAWIALSHDYNTKQARNITKVLATRKKMPEAYLLLAEIAAVDGNEQEVLRALKKFKDIVSQPPYQQLYARYLALLEAENLRNPSQAIKIAKEEINNRPTPESYDLLSWAYYHDNQIHKAMEVAAKYVEHQTFEPDALYHLGMIYMANNKQKKARHYLSEALESEFELGPRVAKEIEVALQKL